jgi:hypothetical protein
MLTTKAVCLSTLVLLFIKPKISNPLPKLGQALILSGESSGFEFVFVSDNVQSKPRNTKLKFT